MSEPAPPAELGRAGTYASYGLVLVLAVLLGIWGAFLLPLRIGTVLVPVSWLIAGVGNAALGWSGGRLLGRIGAAGPGVLWSLVVVPLLFNGPGHDLVVYGGHGLVFLLVGAVASAIAYGATPRA